MFVCELAIALHMVQFCGDGILMRHGHFDIYLLFLHIVCELTSARVCVSFCVALSVFFSL